MTRTFALGLLPSAIVIASVGSAVASQNPLRQIGAATVDITPDYAVRLAGYAVRKTECEGVTQRIFAKALAIGTDREGPAVLITVDICGFPAAVREEVAGRLQLHGRFDSARLAICATHTHSAPLLSGYLDNLFGGPIPPAEQAHVDQYSRQFTDALETVAIKALENRKPARLVWSQGQARFAANRRTAGGPTDHDLPALFVVDAPGNLVAIFASYACHCTTLGGDFNRVCGDWAGYAEEDLERDHPGAIALMGLGCGGDANPQPRSKLELAQQHGQEIAGAIEQLWASRSEPTALRPVTGKLVCRSEAIQLPFDPLPTRAEWEARARQTNHVGNHARLNLARLDRGEALRTELPYLVQTWNFGNDLALVFLPGEVVVDYSLRLKREFDRTRLWVNAYANDVPCYIPSERVLKEGGYEGGDAMIYYDRPTRLAAGIENRIVSTVHRLLPKKFEFKQATAAPEQALNKP
jgi:hypothetical protein